MTSGRQVGGRPRPAFASFYRLLGKSLQKLGLDEAAHRSELVRTLHGQVIEIGAGTGRMFSYYPSRVTELVAVEPEPGLRSVAAAAASAAPVPTRVVAARAECLPFPDAAFDAVVTTLVLCSVAGLEQALAEIRRVVRPGGSLYFIEHVAAGEGTLLRAVQRLLDVTGWPRLFGGCHTSRNIVESVARAGFNIDEAASYRFPGRWLVTPTSTRVRGRGRRPPDRDLRSV